MFESIYSGMMDGKREELVFTQHLVEGAYFIVVVQDKLGNIVRILDEPLFETEVEFEADFEIETTSNE